MYCDLCNGRPNMCDCQYEQVDPILRAKVLAKLTPKQLNPDNYDYDTEWDSIQVDEEEFDINYWFDEGKFFVTAYFLIEKDGVKVTDTKRYFNVCEMTYEGIKDEL